VDDAGNLAFELRFDRDDKTVAADGDEVVLGAASFAQAAQRFAQALFDGTVLAFDRPSDTAELGRRVVVETAVGFDLATQKTQQRSEVVVKERCGQIHDTGPLIADPVGRRVDEAAPCGDAFNNCEKVADLSGFEGGSINVGFVEEDSGVEEAVKLEAAAAGKHGAHLGRTLLLLVDPGKVGAGFECEYPTTSQRRRNAAGDVVAKAWPFQGRCARFVQRRGDDRQ